MDLDQLTDEEKKEVAVVETQYIFHYLDDRYSGKTAVQVQFGILYSALILFIKLKVKEEHVGEFLEQYNRVLREALKIG